MKNRYPIFIPSKGRYEKNMTARSFDAIGADYKVFVEPQEYDLYADWSEIHSTNTTEPIRQFNRMRKYHADGAKFEHQITRAALKEIEGLPHATQEG